MSNNNTHGNSKRRTHELDERASIQDESRGAELRGKVWNLFDGLNEPRHTPQNPWFFVGVLPRGGGGVIVAARWARRTRVTGF